MFPPIPQGKANVSFSLFFGVGRRAATRLSWRKGMSDFTKLTPALLEAAAIEAKTFVTARRSPNGETEALASQASEPSVEKIRADLAHAKRLVTGAI